MSGTHTHGNDWVHGRYTRYMCNHIGQIDEHIRGVTRRYAEQLAPQVSAQHVESARRTYVQDVNALLNARVMLMALESLDNDIESIGGCPEPSSHGPMPILPDSPKIC